MSRERIDYGIDLGTTNSAIARMDNGQVTVFQHEPFKKTILPSAVYFTKSKHIFVGDQALNQYYSKDNKNTFIEFKRAMGSNDKFYSPNMGKHFTPEELSSEVLKALKKPIKDEEVTAAVITVPAAFEQPQIEATRRAAELAGFKYFELLQEPIAASMAYLEKSRGLDGRWLVFDLGGGTFDAALVESEEGIMRIVDHAGDNYLGGKNIDWLIVEKIILPAILKKFKINDILNSSELKESFYRSLKLCAEECKIGLSDNVEYPIDIYNIPFEDDNGAPIELSIRITRKELEDLASPLIDRSINICKKLIEKNNMIAKDLNTILLVGGPTYIPFIRKKIKSELNENIDTSLDPMTVVAYGAAIYASTKVLPKNIKKRDITKIQVELAYPETTAELEVLFGLKIEEQYLAKYTKSKLSFQLKRQDLAWQSGMVEIKNGVATQRIKLLENKTNVFYLELFDEHGNKIPCEPDTFSILQGMKIAAAPLPHDIGISATVEGNKEEEIMVPILKKGTPLPAIEKKIFTTPKALRPGIESDVLKIIVWEGVGGTKPIRNVYINEIIISGSNISSFLPEGSEIEVTLKIDESRLLRASAYIPYIDESIEKVIDPNFKYSAPTRDELERQIENELDRIEKLREDSSDVEGVNLSQLKETEETLLSLKENKDEFDDDDKRRQHQKLLNELATKIDTMEKSLAVPIEEANLYELLNSTKTVVERFGDKDEEAMFNSLKEQADRAIQAKNIKAYREISESLNKLYYQIATRQPGFWISILHNINEQFDSIRWKNKIQARNLIQRATSILSYGRYTDEIKSIVLELWQLMDLEDIEKTSKIRDDIPVYKS